MNQRSSPWPEPTQKCKHVVSKRKINHREIIWAVPRDVLAPFMHASQRRLACMKGYMIHLVHLRQQSSPNNQVMELIGACKEGRHGVCYSRLPLGSIFLRQTVHTAVSLGTSSHNNRTFQGKCSHLIIGRSAKVPMSIPCGPCKVMRSHSLLCHRSLHSLQVSSCCTIHSQEFFVQLFCRIQNLLRSQVLNERITYDVHTACLFIQPSSQCVHARGNKGRTC
jgi:hypothetical protein